MTANFPDDFKTVPIFQMTANFPDYFKTVRIFPDDCQFSGQINVNPQCTNFRGEGVPKIPLIKIAQNTDISGPKTPFSHFSAIFGPFYGLLRPILNLFYIQTPFLALLGEICRLSINGVGGPRTFITHSLAMSWEAKARFLGLSWETVSRTSSGKFLRVESCYPESFGFLRLC